MLYRIYHAGNCCKFYAAAVEMSRKVQSENPLKLSGAGKRFIQNEVERSGTEF